MAVLGTGVSDPGFYQRKAAQAAQAFSMFTDAARRRKDRRDQIEAEELDRFFRTVTAVPELANSPYATDIIKRYGDRRPELAPLVEVIQKQQRLAEEIPRAGEHWLTKQGEMERQYAIDATALQQMPDSYPFVVTPGTGPFDIPNPEKLKLGSELSRLDPNMFPVDALRSLPPMERAKAMMWAKTNGVPIPESFDPWSDDLPQDIRAAYAVDRGLLGPEASEATRVKVGAKQSAARKAEQQYQTREREARQAQQTKEREAREKEAAARLRLSDSLQRGRQEHQAGLTRRTAELKAGLRDGDKASWKVLAEDNAAMIEDWDKRLAVASKDAETTNQRKAAEEAFTKANGKRPRRIPQAHLAAMAAKANKAGEMAPEARQAVVDSMLSSYLAAVETGRPAAEALKNAIGAAQYDLNNRVAPPPEAAKATPVSLGPAEVEREIGRQLSAKERAEIEEIIATKKGVTLDKLVGLFR